MKRIALFIVAICLLTIAGCGGQTAPVVQNEETVGQGRGISALVCEGTNDTILIYLTMPYDGSDPDTLNVLKASKNHRVFGQPNVGDNVVVVRSEQDSMVADVVIVTEDLMGRWSYEVYPTLRLQAGMSADTSLLPDTIKQLLQVSSEYSIDFKKDYSMLAFGGARRTMAEESPVEYPAMKRYTEWRIVDDQLLLYVSAVDSTGEANIVGVDTARFVTLLSDTLVLDINGEEQGFGKK